MQKSGEKQSNKKLYHRGSQSRKIEGNRKKGYRRPTCADSDSSSVRPKKNKSEFLLR